MIYFDFIYRITATALYYNLSLRDKNNKGLRAVNDTQQLDVGLFTSISFNYWHVEINNICIAQL